MLVYVNPKVSISVGSHSYAIFCFNILAEANLLGYVKLCRSLRVEFSENLI